MRKNLFVTLVIVGTLVLVMGLGLNAYASNKKGPGSHGMEPGNCPYGYGANLSNEQITQLKEERAAFLTSTQDVRQQLQEKHLALKSELVKKNPDSTKLSAIQQELTALRSQFDQKRLDHIIAMKKINPDAGKAFGMGRCLDGGMEGCSGGGMGGRMGKGMGNCCAKSAN